MQQIVELELWTKPRTTRFLLDGKVVSAACRECLKLSTQVVLGLSLVPGATDVTNLRRSLIRQEFTAQEFEKFCSENELVAMLSDETSAARFLAYVEGQPLAWLHLPAERNGLNMARQLLRWSKVETYVLRDGHSQDLLLDEETIARLWLRPNPTFQRTAKRPLN